MIYKTIQSHSVTEFDEQCNQAAKDGWLWNGPMTTCMIHHEIETNFILEDQIYIHYSQQWVKSEK